VVPDISCNYLDVGSLSRLRSTRWRAWPW